MTGRVVVVQASSSEDESMQSPTAGGDVSELSMGATKQTKEMSGQGENQNICRYDREEMLKIYNYPMAKLRPSILSPEFDMVVKNDEGGNGDSKAPNKLWSPELWIQNIWNSDTRHGNSNSSGGRNWSGRRQGDHDGPSMNKKKQIDRLKTESEDGIVLSPQRRSFGAGCQVSAAHGVNANVAGSQSGGGSSSSVGPHQPRRSASPLVASGDDRHQQEQAASHQSMARSSFRSRGGPNVAFQQRGPPGHPGTNPAVGVFKRSDSIENWRERNSGGNSNSFGRGGMGKDAPASVRTYVRSRGGGNSWNDGGRRYGPSGGYHRHSDTETLPEWVTEGPSDMYETMELHGFDEEDDGHMEKEQISMDGGHRRGMASVRANHSQSSATDKDKTTGKQPSNGQARNDTSGRGPLSSSAHSQSSKHFSESGKMIGKMTAEALVEGFDLGDMAQFLASAGADFDSVTSNEMKSSVAGNALAGNMTAVPTTPSAGSRFSKFFAASGQTTQSTASAYSEKSEQVPSEKTHSVNIMELLSKAAGGAAPMPMPVGIVPGAGVLPPEAISVDEIEAAYKTSAASRKTEGEAPSNKVLEQLFQSVSSVDPRRSGLTSVEIQQKMDQKSANLVSSDQPKTNTTNTSGMGDTSDQIPKMAQNLLAAGANPNTTGKGNPLADPAQQQHLLEALRKLHVQQQIQTGPQQHPGELQRQDGTGSFVPGIQHSPGLQQFLQQQIQMGNLQAAMSSAARMSAPIGAQSSSINAGQTGNPNLTGILPPANVPPPPITQQDMLLAQAQALYRQAMMSRELQSNVDGSSGVAKPSTDQNTGRPGQLPTAFLPTSVIKQMHGGVKPTKSGGGGEDAAMGARPIVKQQQPMPPMRPQEQANDPMRNLRQQAAGKLGAPSQSGSSGMVGQPTHMAPPPSLTPQDLQRLIEQSQLQRQHQERVLREQYVKTQQQQQHQVLPNPMASSANPAAVSAALALQQNPMFIQMLRAQAIQHAQQLAMMQQQGAVAGSNLSQVPPQSIPATASVSAISSAAQLVRARLTAPPVASSAVANNPELVRHVLQQQQQQQMLMNQLRQQVPTDANMLFNRLLAGQAVPQNQMFPSSSAPQTSSAPMAGFNSVQVSADAKAMTLEELERLHKQAAVEQQPQ